MIKKLNLEKLWGICNILSEKESKLAEEETYVQLLGRHSRYTEMSFKEFLNYYSFKIDEEEIKIFNEDGIPYESYYNDDYSYIPTSLYYSGVEGIDSFVAKKVEEALSEIEKEKVQRKKFLEKQIEMYTNQLNNL